MSVVKVEVDIVGSVHQTVAMEGAYSEMSAHEVADHLQKGIFATTISHALNGESWIILVETCQRIGRIISQEPQGDVVLDGFIGVE